jgi:hypothetical protein
LKLEQRNGKELAEIEKLKKDVESLRTSQRLAKSSQKLKNKKTRGVKN